MVRIVVSGYYGFDNLGDEAVLAGIIRSLRTAGGAGIEITVLSARPEDTAANYRVEAVFRNNWQDVFRAVSRADLLISGGGSLLQDVTSWRTVPYYLSQVFLAQMLGKKTLFYAQGVGPVEHRSLQQMIRMIGNRTDLITVRDFRSRELLTGFGLDPDLIKVTADPVFALPGPGEGRRGAVSGIEETAKPLLGVSVRPWEESSYLPAVAAAADRLAAKTGGSIVIIPMHYQEDLPISGRLQEMIEHDSILLKRRFTPEEMLALFGSLDYLIGVRLHSLIFAAHSLVPFTALSYDPKVSGFLEMLGMEPPQEIGDLTVDSLRESCQTGWMEREKVRELLREKRDDFREKALANGKMALNLTGN